MSVVSKAVFEEVRRGRKEAESFARAALRNEEITRARVERIEDLLGRGFWGRLRWLLVGR